MCYVLKPMSLKKLNEIFDDKAREIIQFQIEKSILAQPERMINQKPLSLQITKEYLEQWCVQAIGAKSVGAGSYAIDIIKDAWGADIKSLSCPLSKISHKITTGETGEASLAQKFKKKGINLDTLFDNQQYQDIKNIWINIVQEKNSKVIQEQNIEEIFYFIFMRGFNKYYLCGLELNLNYLNNVMVDTHRTTKDSVFLNNYIDDFWGSVKIYKAKKRMELRLKALNWINDSKVIEFIIPNQLNNINLREENISIYKKNMLLSSGTDEKVIDAIWNPTIQLYEHGDFDYLLNNGYVMYKSEFYAPSLLQEKYIRYIFKKL